MRWLHGETGAQPHAFRGLDRRRRRALELVVSSQPRGGHQAVVVRVPNLERTTGLDGLARQDVGELLSHDPSMLPGTRGDKSSS